jgi:hypothetical protein
MKKQFNDIAYSSFLQSIELVDILVVKCQYSRGAGFYDKQRSSRLKLDISRAAFQPSHVLVDSRLTVPVAFRIVAKTKDKVMASFEYQYEIVFNVKNVDIFSEIIKDKGIEKFFTNYQADKFVWSALRCSLSDASLSLGINKIVLPMIR